MNLTIRVKGLSNYTKFQEEISLRFEIFYFLMGRTSRDHFLLNLRGKMSEMMMLYTFKFLSYSSRLIELLSNYISMLGIKHFKFF